MSFTIQDLMAALPGAFRPEKASGVNTRIQFNLSGEGGGMWIVNIADGKCTVEQGQIENPAATITANAEDYLAIAQGQMDPVKAFMGGKLSVKGDMGMMMRFMQFFKLPS